MQPLLFLQSLHFFIQNLERVRPVHGIVDSAGLGENRRTAQSKQGNKGSVNMGLGRKAVIGISFMWFLWLKSGLCQISLQPQLPTLHFEFYSPTGQRYSGFPVCSVCYLLCASLHVLLSQAGHSSQVLSLRLSCIPSSWWPPGVSVCVTTAI